MTETPQATATQTAQPRIIEEALAVIDGALGDFFRRELLSSGEVTDVLLDVRAMLRKADASDSPGIRVDVSDSAAASKSSGGIARI